MNNTKTSAVGLTLAFFVIASWVTVHILAVLVLDLGNLSVATILPIIIIQSWLSVGLFIIAHDCLHGDDVNDVWLSGSHREKQNTGPGRLGRLWNAARETGVQDCHACSHGR